MSSSRFIKLFVVFLLVLGCQDDENDNQATDPGLVYLGLMVHLEGWFDEISNPIKFEIHSNAARKLADVFEANGAKVTFEAGPEYIEACSKFENVLLELNNRGHAIGVHADKGGLMNYSMPQFVNDIREMREDAEDLGIDIKHVSGICSYLDWARAAINAGYLFTSGGVGFCAQSMPVDLRPEQYKICESPASCHGLFPLEMKDRINPWKVNTALGNWLLNDPEGDLVILSSDDGIKFLHTDSSLSDQTYTEEDIEIAVNKVEEAISLSDANKVNILYFSLSVGANDVDEDFYNDLFAALKPYVDQGQIAYATLVEMYDEFVKM